MKNHPLVIPPRAPGVVTADALTQSPEAFRALFPVADVVIFTHLDFPAQALALEKYMDLYKNRAPYEKSDSNAWREQRYFDRTRKDYYFGALCDNDPELMHKVFFSGKWNERIHQTNLLVISNPALSEPFLTLRLSKQHSVRFNYSVSGTGDTANILVLPQSILNGLSTTAHRQLVSGLGRIKFLACHDDGHSIMQSYGLHEPLLRAAYAALFKRMPKEFRENVANYASSCLSILDRPDSITNPDETHIQNKFWQRGFIYALQYLFELNDPLLRPFMTVMGQQNQALFNNSKPEALLIQSRIRNQLDRDEPDLIHSPDQQKKGLSMLKNQILTMKDQESPRIRENCFIAVRGPSGTIFCNRKSKVGIQHELSRSLISADAPRISSGTNYSIESVPF